MIKLIEGQKVVYDIALNDKPVFNYLIDPPIYYPWAFDGTRVALPEAIPLALRGIDDAVFFTQEIYDISVPHFVEDVRRNGYHGAFPDKFDNAQLEGKRVFILFVHDKAIPVWWLNDPLPIRRFLECRWWLYGADEPGAHCDDCIFHLWPTIGQVSGVEIKPDHPTTTFPYVQYMGFVFNPYAYIDYVHEGLTGDGELLRRVAKYPAIKTWRPGIVMWLEATEGVCYERGV